MRVRAACIELRVIRGIDERHQPGAVWQQETVLEESLRCEFVPASECRFQAWVFQTLLAMDAHAEVNTTGSRLQGKRLQGKQLTRSGVRYP